MKTISILLLLIAIVSAKEYPDMYTHDVADKAKQKSFAIPMTICGATLGTHSGMYIKLYKGQEKHKTCTELAPLLKDITVNPFSGKKRIPGNAGSISFGKIPNQCHIELNLINGEMVGVPYGNKSLCSGIRSEGTIVLTKPEKKAPQKKKVVETPYVLKILKYGSPHSIGESFSTKSQCEKVRVRLSKENAGLDYTYKCVKQ